MNRVIVIGGGAAGMMAAIAAAEHGAQVTLLERNEKLGKKIYITGKGRCNLTNDCTLDDFLREVPRNPRFLYSALSAFPPQEMMRLMTGAGCPVEVQRGRRVFPQSEKASDVTRALARLMQEAGVQVRLNSRVARLLISGDRVTGVRLTTREDVPADAVIVATGGLSCPMTGSDGDGYRFAEEAGHTLTPRLPSLSAVETVETWPTRLQGLSLRNTGLTLREGTKVRYQEQGELLFTHFGLSGPLVLEMSCHLPESPASCLLLMDLKPALTPEQLDARLVREIEAQPRKQLAHILPSLLPTRLAALFPELAEVDGRTVCAQVSKADRQRLVSLLKAVPLHISRLRPITEAIITRGGVSVREIQPATMASRRVAGLYFAGEVLDVDAHTGGYNLHIAFATGRLAGSAAAEAAAGNG